jgi:hypothetical protein
MPKDPMDANSNANAEKIYSFNVTITDPETKQQVSKSFESVLHTTDAYV